MRKVRTYIALLTIVSAFAGCGGGAGADGAVGYIPVGSGQVKVDAKPETPEYDLLVCGQRGVECNIGINSSTADDRPPFRRVFTFGGKSLPDIAAGVPAINDPCTSGIVVLDGERVDFGDCFRGRFVDPLTAVSDDGRMRLFWAGGFSPNIASRIWYNSSDPTEEYHFVGSSTLSLDGVETVTGNGCINQRGALRQATIIARYPSGNALGQSRVFSAELTIGGQSESWVGTYYGMGAIRLRNPAGLSMTLVLKLSGLVATCG